MEKVLSALEDKVLTKKDLIIYLEKISLIKEVIYTDEEKPLQEKINGELKDEFVDILNYFGDDNKQILEERNKLEEERKKLAKEEEQITSRKEEINNRINQDISPEEKRELQEERKELEYKRRNIEEEIWKLESQLTDLENKINELNNENNQDLKNPQKQLDFLESLEDFLNSFSEVKLTLSYFPERESIHNLRNWLKEEIKKPVVLNIETNSELIGGVIIEYEGRWGDFSLRKKMEEVNYCSLVDYLHD